MKKPLKCVLSVCTNPETAVALVLLLFGLGAFAQSSSSPNDLHQSALTLEQQGKFAESEEIGRAHV